MSGDSTRLEATSSCVDGSAVTDGAGDGVGVSDSEQTNGGDLTTLDRNDGQFIELHAEVDVRDMDPADAAKIAALAELYEDCFEEVVAKNRDYGWSFLNTARTLAETDATPIDDETRSQVYGLLQRSGDKRERIKENVFGNGDSRVSDTPDETAMEAANYMLFIALCLRHPELTR